MDVSKQSTTISNIQLAFSPKALRRVEPSQQLPLAFLQKKLQASIWKTELCISPRSYFTGNALTSKIHKIITRSNCHRLATVMQGTSAEDCAAALVGIAQSNEILETVNEDVCKLSQLLQNQELYDSLVKPIFQAEKKKSILKAVADDVKFQPCTLIFLDFLVDQERMDIIMDIMQEFDLLYNELTDTQVVVVTSAIKLDKYQIEKIARKIQRLSSAKNVRIKNVIDPSLIAGFIISYGKDGQQTIDMCVRSQLEKLAAQIDSMDKVGECNESWIIPNGISNGVLLRDESSILSLLGDSKMQMYL